MIKQTFDKSDDFNDERKRVDNERIMSELNLNEKLIVEYLIQNEKIVNKEASSLTGLSSAQIRRLFVSLQKKQIIEGIGKSRGRFYQLVKKVN